LEVRAESESSAEVQADFEAMEDLFMGAVDELRVDILNVC
jgi:hypothetical protein